MKKQKKTKPNKGAYNERNFKKVEGKREHDRQSGTGRGKEISKGGAGGKHTWGTNNEEIARRKDDEFYNEGDDDVFNYVLNAKPKEEKTGEKTEKAHEKIEEGHHEETHKEKAEQEGGEDHGEKWERKKKKGAVEEKKEEILERPVDALSYKEYQELLKQKNQKLQQPTQTRKVEDSTLQTAVKVEKEISLAISTADTDKKHKAKKEKKVNTKENELNALVANSQHTGEEERKDYGGKEYQKRDYRGKQNKKEGGAKFNYNPDEFPEL